MAKKRTNGTSKSDIVRELLAKHPELSAKDIAGKAGVTPNLVYFIKAQTKARVRKAKRVEQVESPAQKAGITNPVQLITDVRRLCKEAGGAKQLKELVDLVGG